MMTIFVKLLRRAAIALCVTAHLPLAAQTIPPIPTGHPRILLVGAELQRLREDLNNGAAYATRFRSMVDNAVGGANIYDYKPWYSAMIGVIRGNTTYPQYCAHAVNRTEAFVVSEEAVIASGQRATVSYDVYLEVGDLIGNVMLVYDWCYDVLTPTQRARWLDYSSRAVTNVWDPPNARWGSVSHPWNGWSINNPVNNYYYSFLRATMLYGIAAKHDRADADTWLTQFRTTKLNNQLVPLFNSDLAGGGSREGTGYGTAMKGLFHLYYIWEKTTGERIADLTTHTASSMPYLVHSMMPTRDRIAPIGDHARDSTATFYDYQRESLMALSTLYRGSPMARRVRAELAASTVPQMQDSFNIVYDYFYGGTDAGTAANLNTVYRGAGTGHLFVRSAWTTNATWLGFLTGPYTESHAHPDGLSLLLFKNGWLVNDANMQSHSGLQNVQEAHALVTQRVGGTVVRMYETTSSSAQLTALSQRPLYLYAAANQGTLFNHPSTGNPGVQSKREIVYVKPDVVVVFDRVQYTPGSSVKTFQLPTPYLPTISGRTATVGNGVSSLRLHAVAPASATLSTTSYAALDPDFTGGGHRIDVSVTGSGETKFMNVLSIDNAAATVTGSPTDSGEVTITLTDGRSVLLRFNASAPGGTIEIRDAGGQVVVSEPLAGTVETIAETIPTQETLTVSKTGTGGGTVSSLPSGINCGSTCSAVFNSGTGITLSAIPNIGSSFAGWSGGCSGTGNCQITLAGATAVSAIFTLIPPTVPGAPTAFMGTAGNQRVIVGFAPPAINGGAPITGYTLTCTAGSFTGSATGAASPLAIGGLTNGTAYDCSVTASNAVGSGAASAPISITPTSGATLTLVGAYSRKTHGAAGPFDLPLTLGEGIDGAITVEPRSEANGHTLLLQFNDTVGSVGTVSVLDASATIAGNATASASGYVVTVPIQGIADGKRVTVTVNGVNGGPAFSVALGFMVGDFNHTRAINASDISAMKQHAVQVVNAQNYLFDVNVDGLINGADMSATRTRSGRVFN
ncbi:MAG: hypothetical protein JNN20_01360 [Betaproteobacteria bacterium]|nr:hypothetical protein [Betaproteobacteria bacterium]